MTKTKFPLISDNEAIFSEVPHMDLYDEFDFISNIKGDYQEKTFADSSSSSKTVAQPIPSSQSEKRKQVIADKVNQSISPKVQEKSYAEMAREEARADLKKKRSAPYLTSEIPNKIRNRKVSAVAHSTTEQPKPTATFQKNAAGEFAKFGNKLKQESYILAEIKPDYRPKTQKFKEKPKKNTYDFLKNSQVYKQSNPQEEHKKHRMAQELNLTKLDKE